MRSPQEVQQMMDEKSPSFTGMLYRLMQKADTRNWAKLRNAFPQEAREYVSWLHSHSRG